MRLFLVLVGLFYKINMHTYNTNILTCNNVLIEDAHDLFIRIALCVFVVVAVF